MSTGLHTIIEKRVKTSLKGDRWYNCNNFRLNEEYYLEHQGVNNKFKETDIEAITPILVTNDVYFQWSDGFGKLAGVRSSEDAFIEPRGLPEDCNITVKQYYNSNKWFHTPTWYSLKELIDYVDDMTPPEYNEEDFGNKDSYNEYVKDYYNPLKDVLVKYIHDIVNYIYDYDFEYDSCNGLSRLHDLYKHNIDQYRIIIWFDN